eukprot:IDg21674t1
MISYCWGFRNISIGRSLKPTDTTRRESPQTAASGAMTIADENPDSPSPTTPEAENYAQEN